MKHRERKAFEEITRALAADDPRLAELLSEQPDVVYRRACRVSSVMGVAGLLLVLAGALLVVDSLLGVGIMLLLTFWLPRHLAHPSTRRGSTGS